MNEAWRILAPGHQPLGEAAPWISGWGVRSQSAQVVRKGARRGRADIDLLRGPAIALTEVRCRGTHSRTSHTSALIDRSASYGRLTAPRRSAQPLPVARLARFDLGLLFRAGSHEGATTRQYTCSLSDFHCSLLWAPLFW